MVRNCASSEISVVMKLKNSGCKTLSCAIEEEKLYLLEKIYPNTSRWLKIEGFYGNNGTRGHNQAEYPGFCEHLVGILSRCPGNDKCSLYIERINRNVDGISYKHLKISNDKTSPEKLKTIAGLFGIDYNTL